MIMGVDDLLKNRTIPAAQRARIILYVAQESRPNGGELSQAGYVGRLNILIDNMEDTPLRKDIIAFRDEISDAKYEQINTPAFEILYKQALPSIWRRAA